MTTIPTQLRTADEALRAIGAYVTWRATLRDPTNGAQFMGGDGPWRLGFVGPPVPPWDHRGPLYAQLDHAPGPPPVVMARRDGHDAARVPSRAADTDQRGTHTVRVPYGPYGPAINDALAELTELARDVQLTRAFAARCDALAELETANGHVRQAEKFAREASELTAFADQLETDAVPVLGASWLSEWRSAAAAYGTPTPNRTSAPVRPVQLR